MTRLPKTRLMNAWAVLGPMTLCVALPSLAPAQDLTLDDIVVTADRSPQTLARTGVSISVVTADDLKSAATQSVGAYLATLPGISVTSYGPFGTQSELSIRGAGAQYIAVYVDGVRVDDPTQIRTSYDFGMLMTSDVDRIEVLRGSQSALWGGSAVGGVINITTKSATTDGTHQSLAVEGGSYGTVRLSYGYTRKVGDLETSVNLTRTHTDGFSAAATGHEPDGGDATRLSVTSRYKVNDILTIGGSAFNQTATLDYDGYDPITYDPADEANFLTRHETGARLFALWTQGATEHEFDLSALHSTRDYHDTYGGTYEGTRLAAGWKATTRLSGQLSLVYGLDASRDGARLNGGDVSYTTLAGAWGQALWSPDGATDITASVRADQNSDFGFFPTARLSVNHRLGDGLTLRGALARGFRAPSVYERYGDASFGIAPNAGLDPETSLSGEFGADLALQGGMTLGVTAFALNTDKAITYCGSFATACTTTIPAPYTNLYENVPGITKRRGAEMTLQAPLGTAWSLTGSYTYTDAFDPNGDRLAYVPRNTVQATFAGPISDRLKAQVALSHMSDETSGSAAVPAYTVVNVTTTYSVNPTTEVYARLENLFDATYQTRLGYATSGRALYVGLRKSF